MPNSNGNKEEVRQPQFTVIFQGPGSCEFVISTSGVTPTQMLTAAIILAEEAKRAINLDLYKPIPRGILKDVLN